MSPQRRPTGGGGSGGSGGGSRGGRGGREFGRKYTPRRKVCSFCVDKIKYIDYKDVPRLRRHLSERGKIEPRRKTGTCARHQRAMAGALKRARHVALLPYTAEHIRLSGMVIRSPDDRRRDSDRGPRAPIGQPAGNGRGPGQPIGDGRGPAEPVTAATATPTDEQVPVGAAAPVAPQLADGPLVDAVQATAASPAEAVALSEEVARPAGVTE